MIFKFKSLSQIFIHQSKKQQAYYLKDDKDGAVIMYGYNFPKNSKIGKSLDFYISSDGDVCRIVLSGEE